MNTSIVATIKQNIKYFAANDRNYFEEIKAKINNEVKLSEVALNAGFELKKAPKGELKMCCPFHQEKTASLHINDANNLYHCFGCSVGGNLFTFVSEYHGKEGNDVIEFFAENYNINIDLRDNMPTQKPSTPREKKAPKKAFKPIALHHLDLATFPDDYKIIKPGVIECKDLLKVGNPSLASVGVAFQRRTFYIYHDHPQVYRIRIEAFDANRNRLSVVNDDKIYEVGTKSKIFRWEWTDGIRKQATIPLDPNAPKTGKGSQKKMDIPPYKYSEAIAFGKGKIILMCEGEKDVETLRGLGLVAISFNFGIDFLKTIDCDGFLIIGDNDSGGSAQLEKVCKFCTDNQLPFRAVPISHFWMDAPPKADITDFYIQFCLDNCDGTPDDETNRAFVEMLKDLLDDIEGNQDFSVGDFIAHNKTPNRKLQILEITDSYQDGDNGMLSGYYVKGFGFDQAPHFIAKSVVVPYIETATDREKREQEEAFTKAMAALDVIDLVVENAVIPSENAITTELSEIPKTEEINPKLPENSENVRGIIFHKDFHTKLGNPKIVTRRKWADKTGEKYIKYFEDGTLIPALSASQGNGQVIGYLKLTERPHRQPLLEMTKQDLIDEGCGHLSREQFIADWFDGNSALSPWVLKFEYFPNETRKQIDSFVNDYQSMTTEQREEIYTEIALNELFTDKINPYRAIDGELYQWTGTHYEKCKEALVKNRISRWLVNFSPKLALKEKVNQVWEWAITNLPVDLDEINPGGINVLNGVLKVNFDANGKGTVSLEKHNPRNIYTYCAPIKYDPDLDPVHYEKLMDCLDQPQRKIFIRTMATAFDLPYFKAKNGRPRALLLNGTGSNGKDALGKSIKAIFGHSIANASLGDFRDYDGNRKFPIAKLDSAMVSWSSENVGNTNIEDIQSLKAAISGETLSYELKGGNERPFEPRCVFVFNCNKPPSFKSDIEAIKTRWAILNFTKTFKTHPNKKNGECQADPRFNDDLEFIHTHLAPAMLNDMIAQLADLAIDGIDYSPVTQNLEAIQKQSSHLFQFCEDVKIVQNSEGMIWVSDLWQLLRQWYIDNGVLEVIEMEKGKTKEIWNEQAAKGDQNVKASNQVVKRFVTLFPKVSRCVEVKDRDNLNRVYLRGIEKIALTDLHPCESSDTGLTTDLQCKATVKATTIDTSECKSVKANNPILSVENLKSQSLAEKIKLLGSLFTEQELKMMGLSTQRLAQIIDTCYNLLQPTIAATLRNCLQSGDINQLADARSEYPGELLTIAARSLDKDERSTLKKWVAILDHPFKIGEKAINKSRPHEQITVIEVAGEQVRVEHPFGKEWVSTSELQKL